MQVSACGAEAIIVDVTGSASPLKAVLHLRAQVEAMAIPGVRDIVPAARTLLVTCDPAVLDPAELRARVASLQIGEGDVDTQDSRTVRIPTLYDGPDLPVLGDARALIDAHTQADWLAAFGGFAPGFVYLSPAERLWDIPRRDQPRPRIPAGSVGLAGEFSGIYPQDSPGGWQLIGRTTETLWDLNRDEPALIRPGDHVQFVEVDSL